MPNCPDKCDNKDGFKCTLCIEESEYIKTLIGKIWYTKNNGLLIKLPQELNENNLPIKLERSVAIILKNSCIEIRNLIPK